MRRLLLLVSMLCVLGGVQTAGAQQRELRGTVTDATTGRPLAGANVLLGGSTVGTLTDAAGRFALPIPAGDVRVRVRLIGYRSTEVAVSAGQTTMNVGLEQDVLNLEGVVITGQATTVARRNLANAVATVTAEQLTPVTAQTVEKALQGKIAGANIQTNSGAPGGGVQVNLRGVSSINASAEPLWVIDGVVVSNVAVPSNQNAVTRAASGSNPSLTQDAQVNRIADINPEDIDRIEVLKGASAAAIYGSQASNGVILVTTKRGQGGAPRINVTQRFGTYQLSKKIGSRRFETLGEALDAYAATAADTARITQIYGSGESFDLEQQLAGRTDLSTETSFTVNGGTSDTRYFISGLVLDEAGIIENTGFEKQSLRVNLDQRLGSRLDVGVNANVLHSVARRGLTNNDNSGTSFFVAYAGTPSFVDLARRPDGTFPLNPFANSNPLQTAALMDNSEDVWRYIAGASGNLDLLGGGEEGQSLQLRLNGGADYFTQENALFFPPELQFEQAGFDVDEFRGTSLLSNSNNLNLNGSANLVHTFSPGAGMNATTSAGVQYVDNDLSIARMVGRNMVGGQRNVDAATNVQVRQQRQRVRTLGLYLQEELLLLDERMLLTGSLRADRSSANGDPEKYFLYPKAAASYRFPELTRGVDELKLRLAYGESGNQPLFGQKFTPLTATSNVEGLPALVVQGTAGDPNITPERMREIEGGFDAILFGGNATLEFTLYQQQITDLLLQRTSAPSTGFTAEIFNGGELQTRGIEVTLSATPLRRGTFSWVTRTTFSSNRSEIVELPVPSFRAGGFGTALGTFQIEEGKSATQIVGYNGVDANGALIVDQLGDANPRFKMSFSNDFTFGDFNLYGLLDWQNGGKVINLTTLLYDLGQVSPDYELPAGVSSPRPIPECHPNCSGVERVVGLGTYTAPFLEDASFLKLRELTLSYALPASTFNRLGGRLQNARIALSGRNLFSIDDYSGFDPEVSNFGNQQIARNIDVAPFPPSRSFWLSLSLGF